MNLFRGGLVFKAHRLLYPSTLGSRVIQKKKFTRTSAEPRWNLRRMLAKNEAGGCESPPSFEAFDTSLEMLERSDPRLPAPNGGVSTWLVAAETCFGHTKTHRLESACELGTPTCTGPCQRVCTKRTTAARGGVSTRGLLVLKARLLLGSISDEKRSHPRATGVKDRVSRAQVGIQEYLAHEKQPPALGPLYDPRYSHAVGS